MKLEFDTEDQVLFNCVFIEFWVSNESQILEKGKLHCPLLK